MVQRDREYGAERNASSRPRARPGSISTRSAAGGPGTPTSPCPCSRWPGWPPPGRRPKKRDRHQRPRHDRLHPARDPPPADQLDPGLPTRPRGRLVLVPLAPATPVPGPAMPLPATRLRTHLSAVAVLGTEPAGDVEPERLTRSHGPQAGFQVGQARVAERALPARPDVAGRSAPDSARPLSGAELRADQPT